MSADAAIVALADRVLALSTRAPRRSLALARRVLARPAALPSAHRARLERVYGHALRAAGEYEVARAAYLRSRALYRRAGLEEERAVAALGLIDACMYLGRSGEAFRVADEARRVFLRVRDTRRLAMLETNVGNVHHQVEDLPRALEHYERASRLLAPIGTPIQIASLDHNRANALTHLGRREEAEALYRKALEVFRANGEPVLAAQVRYGLACLRFLHGEYATAIVELEDVRPELERLGARPLLALADLDLAEVLVAMRLYPEARTLARSARTWFRRKRALAQAARCELVLALASLGEGRDAETRTAATAAHRLFTRLRYPAGRALVSLIRCRLDLAAGQHGPAERRALRARRVFLAAGFPVRALAAGALAAEAALAAGAWTRARTLARAMVHAPPRPGDAFSRMRLARVEGAASAAMGDARRAMAAYREAVGYSAVVHASQFVDEWRVGFLGGEPALLEESLGVLLAQRPAPRVGAIWNWIARVREAEQSPERGAAESSPAVADQVTRLRAELEACYAQLWRLQGAPTDAPTRALHGHPIEQRAVAIESRLRRLAGSSCGDTARARGSRVAPPRRKGEATILYFPARGSVGALRRDADGDRLFVDLAPFRDVERHVRLLHHQMELRAARVPSLAGHQGLLRERVRAHFDALGHMLLDPVLDSGTRPSRVTIIPWGVLHRVPFHALPWRGCALAARAEVAVELRPWSGHARRRQAREGAAVFAFDAGGDLAVADEARAVAHVLEEGGVRTELRTGVAATRAALEHAASRAAVLHVAGHAVYRALHPEFSALRLADGCFNARDFAALDLRGATVVLSACETGPRGVGASDETLGLVRGLVHAGARTVLASLWRVDDRATTQEMGNLYDAWSTTRTLGQAWREAQVRTAVTEQDPFLWAAFGLYGDAAAPWPGTCRDTGASDILTLSSSD